MERRKCLPEGTGKAIQQENQLLLQFEDMRKMMKTIGKFQGSGRMMPKMPFMK